MKTKKKSNQTESKDKINCNQSYSLPFWSILTLFQCQELNINIQPLCDAFGLSLSLSNSIILFTTSFAAHDFDRMLFTVDDDCFPQPRNYILRTKFIIKWCSFRSTISVFFFVWFENINTLAFGARNIIKLKNTQIHCP